MKRFRFSNQEEEFARIDLSPMIDCIFILLIFFIVTTVFVEEKGIQIAKPDVAASTPLEKKESLELEITADDKILVGEKEIRLSEVAELVHEAVKDPETPVVIRAHEVSKHGTFVSVWDAAKLGGALKLSFNTYN